MKHVTITLEDEVSRWAKIWAAKNDTSVSKLLGQLLKERMLEEQGYHASNATVPFPGAYKAEINWRTLS